MKKKFLKPLLALVFTGFFLTSCSNKNVANEPTISTQIEVETNTSETATDSLNSDSQTSNSDLQIINDESKISNADIRIVCWGDSLTEGTGGEGVTMPNTLEALSGATVLNYGVYAENTSSIAARQGGNPQYLTEDIIIPADCTPVKAAVAGKYGYEMFLIFGDAGVNNVTLSGIEGTYACNPEDGQRYFTRIAPGDEVTVPAGTQLFTHGMLDKKPDDILVIWAGGNDTPQTEAEFDPVFDKIDEMLEYQGCSKYIVISDMNTHFRIPLTDEFNEAFSKKYGEHFLNARAYLMDSALDQLGITPTDADKAALERGDIPISLRMTEAEDEVHGNADYYRIVGEQVYKKMQELGYLE